MLLDLGASLELADISGNTPLHYGAAWGHLKVIRSLIERDAPLEKPNRQGYLPEHYSCTYETQDYYGHLVADKQRRRDTSGEREAARARPATPVFGNSERVVGARQRASSGS